MSDLEALTKKIIAFRDARDWKQFHNPKDCAISLSLEAAEFLEHFQWKNGEELGEYIKKNKESLADELADILSWVLMISHDLDIDLAKSFSQKMAKNEAKYPLDKSKGRHVKYTEL